MVSAELKRRSGSAMILILAAALGCFALFGLLVDLLDRKSDSFDEEILYLRLKNDLADGMARASLWLSENRPSAPSADLGEVCILQGTEPADRLVLALPDDLALRTFDRGEVSIQIYWLNYRPSGSIFVQNLVSNYPLSLEAFLKSEEKRVFSQSYATTSSSAGFAETPTLRAYLVQVRARLDERTLQAEEVLMLER